MPNASIKVSSLPTARQVYRLLELSQRNGTVLVAALATLGAAAWKTAFAVVGSLTWPRTKAGH
jgi:hypothetical protein